MIKDCGNCGAAFVCTVSVPGRVCDSWKQPNAPIASSDGSTASYYALPEGATELQDLISHKDLNAQTGEIFRACYRYGQVAHSPKIRDIKKIIFYAQAELERLEKLENEK